MRTTTLYLALACCLLAAALVDGAKTKKGKKKNSKKLPYKKQPVLACKDSDKNLCPHGMIFRDDGECLCLDEVAPLCVKVIPPGTVDTTALKVGEQIPSYVVREKVKAKVTLRDGFRFEKSGKKKLVVRSRTDRAGFVNYQFKLPSKGPNGKVCFSAAGYKKCLSFYKLLDMSKDKACLTLGETLKGHASDRDQDGIPNFVEDRAPNGGDGNDDNIPDSVQPHVTSFVDKNTGDYITLVTDIGTKMFDVATHEIESVAGYQDGPWGPFSVSVRTYGTSPVTFIAYFDGPSCSETDVLLTRCDSDPFAMFSDFDKPLSCLLAWEVEDNGEGDCDNTRGVIQFDALAAVQALNTTAASTTAAPSTTVASTTAVI